MAIELKQYTIRHFLECAVNQYPENPSIAFAGGKAISYQRLYEKVCQLALELVKHHIHAGSKVVILGENSPNWVISYLAVTSIGAVAVPVLPGFSDANIRHIIRDSESEAVILSKKFVCVLDDFETPLLANRVAMENFAFTKIKDSLTGQANQLLTKLKDRFDKESQAADVFQTLPMPSPGDLAVLIYTSGTTGNSKGVMLSHENIMSDMLLSLQRFPLTPDDRFLSILPLSHTYEATGGLLCPLASGVSIYYLKGLPTPSKLLTAMSQVKPTGVLTVPLVVDKIYRRKILPGLQKKKLIWNLYQMPLFRKALNKAAGRKMIQSLGGCLRFFMFGGAALNQDVEQFLVDANISYSTGYGMTETSPILTINPFGRVRKGSSGQPIPGIEMKIENPDPETGIGEICVKGPIVMQGYYKNEKATHEMMTRDGWLKTGDLGLFDEDGYLYIRGRSKNVIVGPDGENIYPEIIEQQLIQSAYIDECVVYHQSKGIVAKIHLDQDNVDEFLETCDRQSNQNRDAQIAALLEQEREAANLNLPINARIKKLEIFPEPFEKTPTNKVKRYLYIPKAG